MPAQVIVMKLSANAKQKITATINTSSQVHFQKGVHGNDILVLKGKAPAHADPSYFNENKEPIIYEDTAN